MGHSHSPKHLVKRDEIYYFRMAIPTDLRARFGCNEVKASLHTDDRRLARVRCRYLSNRFEQLFVIVNIMAELTQEQLQTIARTYFRELLIGGNDRIFWIEDMWRNDPEDRAEAVALSENRESKLRELHQQGAAAKLFAGAVDTVFVLAVSACV